MIINVMYESQEGSFVQMSISNVKVYFTDSSNLNVNSGCLSLECGGNPMFREFQCSASLPTICSALGRSTI